jgi:hypothetical protein
MDDLTAEQMVWLLETWATFLDDTGGPPSIIEQMDALSRKITKGEIGPTEATAAVRAFTERIDGLSCNDLDHRVL